MKEAPEPQLADIKELISFLPTFCVPGFEPVARWTGGEKNKQGVFVAPYPIYKDVVESFFTAASKPCWQDYNYASKDFGCLLHNESRMASATLEELKTAITASVRGQRFCDDYWAGAIEQGEVQRILERLSVILRERTQPGIQPDEPASGGVAG